MSSSVTDARVRVISECLNKGFTNNQIAAHLGVTPSAVTQLCEEYSLSRGEVAAKAAGIDEKLDSVEELLVSKLHSRLQNPNSQLNEMQIGNLLRTVNSCKRRSEGAPPTTQTVNNVVNIHLPAYVVKNIIVNAQNELLEIDGKPLISLPANEVEKMFSPSISDAHIIEEGKPHEANPLEGI